VMDLDEIPLVQMPESRIRPSKEALNKVMAELV
jgi:hypothetical protein